MSCLDEPTVVRFVAGKLDGALADTIDEHLAECSSCRDLVVWAARTTLAVAADREPEQPSTDRYVIDELIGTGGQGLVYAATDTVLARTVALKILRHHDAAILAEARLIARLNHPNIVAVYDAGTTRDGAIYLAMERVAGALPAWREGKSQSEILRACADAGKGLAAAHEAGIIHRDIKPSNILVGDGRARVTDFGLALEAGATQGLAGTLAYMAPEQHEGVATPASDQFGLAVTCWESLTGKLPFANKAAIAGGPPASGLPRRIDAALRRAMSVDASARFPSVAAFVAALERPSRSRYWIGGAVFVVAGAVALVGTRDHATCRIDLQGVWDDAARARITNGFGALHESFAVRASDAAVRGLDRYAGAWSDAKARACGEPETVYILRTQCLDERKAALASAVRTLAAPDAEIARHAQDIVDGLPSLAPCDDTATLTQRERAPRDAVVIDDSLADGATAMRAGKIKLAVELAQRADVLAATIDHAPTRARAAVALGEALAHVPDNAAAEAALERATQWAQRGRDDRIAAEAFVELVKVVGYGFGRWDEALREAAFADAIVARIGDDPALHATLELHRCAVYDELARFAEAAKSCAAALATRTTAFGENDVSIADILILQAKIATNQSKYPDAEPLARRALAIRERVLGPDHPSLVEALFVLGQVDVRLGKLADAEAAYERAMKLALPAFGEDSPVVGSVWAERSVIAARRGDLATAIADIDRSTAIRERVGGPMHVDLVFNLTMRGRFLDDSGKTRDAEATLARALAIAEHSFGKDHPSIAAILQDLGRIHAKLGDLVTARAELDRAIAIAVKANDRNGEAAGESALAEMLHAVKHPRDAVPYYEHALATYEAVVGPDSPQLVATLENLALAHVDLHEPAAALPLLERAVTIESASTGESSRLVMPLDTLGDAQLALGQRANAKATWQRALALPDAAKLDPENTADVKTKLARLQ